MSIDELRGLEGASRERIRWEVLPMALLRLWRISICG